MAKRVAHAINLLHWIMEHTQKNTKFDCVTLIAMLKCSLESSEMQLIQE